MLEFLFNKVAAADWMGTGWVGLEHSIIFTQTVGKFDM